jgi:hypothetical protein
MKGYKHLEHLSDRYELLTLAYLGGVHIHEETVLVTIVVWRIALWTSTAIFCRIQLSLPCTCRYRSLQENNLISILEFSACDCLFCEMENIYVQGRTKL